MKYSILWASVLLLILTGCSCKQYAKSDPKLITIKTSQLRFNDLGYVRTAKSAVQVELFSAGHAIERFEIDGMVCLKSRGCMFKSSFNSDYLHESYPDDLLKHVFLGQAIYEGKNLVNVSGGFEQSIRTAESDIVYRVSPDETYFKDRRQKIIIKLKTMKK